MAKYLWSNVTPWLKADVDFVTRAPPSDVFQDSPFLGLHIRRGDKVSQGEAHMYLCKVRNLLQPPPPPFVLSRRELGTRVLATL